MTRGDAISDGMGAGSSPSAQLSVRRGDRWVGVGSVGGLLDHSFPSARRRRPQGPRGRPAGHRGAPSNDQNSRAATRPTWVGRRGPEPVDHALGRSRGGWTSKLHLICDGRGRAMSIGLTGGNVNETTMLPAALVEIGVQRRGRGRPRTTPDQLLGDKGYFSKGNRTLLADRSIVVTIPERADQQANRTRRGSAGGRPYAFDTEAYKGRNVIERAFNRLKHWRGIATRYDKTAINYRGGIVLASAFVWLTT